MKTINVNKTCRIAVFSLACCLAAPSWADDLNRGEWGVRYESQAVMQKELVKGCVHSYSYADQRFAILVAHTPLYQFLQHHSL